MAQISKGDTFVDGQQVTGARLNQLVDSSQLLVGAITDQPNITANTLESTDSTIVNDGGVLKEATIGDILNSGLNATLGTSTENITVTPIINGKPNTDIKQTPNDGVLVTGKAFSSVDGITAVVTHTAHGLESNMLLDVVASNSAYTGLQVITVLTVDSFSFVISQTTPVAASGTLNYTKKGSVRVAGNEHISGQLTVAGKTKLDGSLAVAGSVTASGSLTSTGDANFTGTLKVNGSTGYVLYEVVEETIAPWNATVAGNYNGVFTSAQFTKPTEEIWRFEINYTLYGNTGYGMVVGARYGSQTVYSGTYKSLESYSISTNAYTFYNRTLSWHEGTGVVLTADTVKIDTYAGNSSGMAMFYTTSPVTFFAGFATSPMVGSKFRIYKYKTA